MTYMPMPNHMIPHLNDNKALERLIGSVGNGKGPTIVFTGGIHGNEPSGVMALQDVMAIIRAHDIELNGKVIALAGNLNALNSGIRFATEDLNRVWTRKRVEQLVTEPRDAWNPEQFEQYELYSIIQRTLEEEQGPFYFIDLHTTSGDTMPFITINDALINRKFAEKFAVPIILGIEEYLEGPMLSYINEFGYVACGFEAGKHESEESYRNQVAFIMRTLEICGLMNANALPSFKELIAPLDLDNHDFYEIRYRYAIENGENFEMKPGFENFEMIQSGEVLAESNGKVVEAPQSGQIFMPLYQKQGDDGFFIIRRINRWALGLSAVLRKIKMDSILTLLPGVRRAPDQLGLEVNMSVAKFLARDFFHLLGYRSRVARADVLYMSNRERTARTKDYKKWL